MRNWMKQNEEFICMIIGALITGAILGSLTAMWLSKW